MPLNTIRLPDQGDYETDWLADHPEAAQRLLSEAHGSHALCLCRQPHPKLYVARREETYYLARFPDSGPSHAPRCASYSPDPRHCGRGGYAAGAMTELPDGRISIRLGVALDTGSGGVAPPPPDERSPAAGGSRKDLALTGLLHLLWDRAQFNRWGPAMRGRRQYRQIHRYLIAAASGVVLRRRPLDRQIWMPEPFVFADKPLIDARRAAAFERLSHAEGTRRRRMLLAGQIKAVFPADGGACVLRLAHAPPDLLLACSPRETARLRRLADVAFADWPTLRDDLSVFVLVTMDCVDSVWMVARAASLAVDRHYLPVVSDADLALTSHLVGDGRYFYKPLAYDADANRYPTVLLTDAGPDPVPLELTDASESDEPVLERVAAAREADRLCWHWDRSATPSLPTQSIPRPRRRRSATAGNAQAEGATAKVG